MTFFGTRPYKQHIYHSATTVLVIKPSERRLELFITIMLLFIPLNEEAHPILSIKARLELLETKHLLKGIH